MEKEQRLKEEAIEEARLAKEREKLNQAFAIEQKRKQEKEVYYVIKVCVLKLGGKCYDIKQKAIQK